jgi:hypothetical protein
MKKYYSLSVIICMMLSFTLMTTNAQDIMYEDSWGQQGFSLLESKTNITEINFSLEQISFEDINLKGEDLKAIKVPGIFLPNDEGAPDLPGTGRYIAIPQGATVSYKITASRTETINNIAIAPAPRIPLDTEEGPLHFEKNIKIYNKNALFPAEPVKISNPTSIRGIDVVLIGITPFQYNPKTKQLIIYRDIKVEISYEGGNGHFGEDRLRSRWWDPIVKDAILNQEVLPEIDYAKKNPASKTPDYEYLIITPNDPVFLAWADSIKEWRTLQGIKTGVVTTTDVGGNTTTAIENYVNNAYNTWDEPPAAVLLLGDYGTGSAGITSYMYSHPAGYPNFVSDNRFADVTGNELPDIVFARITANNAAQLEVMITKFLDYERNPPTDANFYDHPITALGWQTERWFQICSETIGGYFKYVQGKNPVRINAIYSGTPGSVWSTATNTSSVTNYFGPSGLGYIPASPSTLGGFSGGTATDVVNAINSGSFLLQHRDHGSYSGWGEPSFQSSHINSLTNVDNKLPFIFSINCQTGAFHNSSECFAEKFHRHTYGGQNSGALGLTAATEVSYSFVNDVYVWGSVDNMWPDYMPSYGTTPPSRDVLPAFGNAAAKHFLYQSSWPYNTGDKLITYRLFHHHGGAFLQLYSEVPQYLSVTHNPALLSGATSFNVTADAGSFIAITANGEILGTAEGTGSPVAITIPGQTPGSPVIVTVTKQNYYRYSSQVEVIPPSGPFVAYESHIISDPTGNNNGIADFGEDITLDFNLENVGSAPAYNVNAVLVCTDTYVTITDNSAPFGTINSGSISTVADAFAMTMAADIPDQHILNFEVQISGNSDDVWTSYFSIIVNAPFIETGVFTINDASGGNNNGKLDPGETATLYIETSNTGSTLSPEAIGSVSCANPYITVNTSTHNMGNIAAGNTVNAQFSVSVSSSCPVGTSVSFNYNVLAGYYNASDLFNAIIGQTPILIIDLDDNASSAPAMEAAINAIGIPYDKLSAIPTDLDIYASVFVCLGIYSNNTVLSSTQGNQLASYLNNGGNLYMEGGDTWAYDSQTAVHAMFNIDGQSDGSGDMGTVVGKSGTFTQGMSFNYAGENSWMDRLGATSPAFVILENVSPSYGTAVAYDEGTYKTIGTSHEFGGLADGSSPSTKEELMYQYLDFFGIIPPPLPELTVDLKVYLQGAFFGTDMNPALNSLGYLPLSQPYGTTPWNYFGLESVASIPNANVIDWILVELRETSGGVSTANGSTTVAKRAGFLLRDGSIVDVDGTSPLMFNIEVTQNLFAVIYHRNHLSILSNYALPSVGTNYTYDFSSGPYQVYGGYDAHSIITVGIWGMTSGDANCDGEVDNKDKDDVWLIHRLMSGYYPGDFNMNGTVTDYDVNTFWDLNAGKCCKIIQ